MNFWQEFRLNWRPMVAATIGLSAGMSLIAFVNSVFGPYLLNEFHWSRAQFALLGMTSILTIVFIPLAGRMTDLFGVRWVALVGIISFPVCCVMFSLMNGDIRLFFAITILQVILGMSTTTTVYCRLVAESFRANRGIALAIAASGPAVVGGTGSPLLTAYMDAHGWRAGYHVLAIFSAILGMITLMLLRSRAATSSPMTHRPRRASQAYAAIASNPAFWILLSSAVLCSLPHALAASQLKVMLLEHHLSSTETGFMVSIFAIGVLMGRFVAGIALDRFPTHVVAAIGMGMPFFGLTILATGTNMLPLLGIAVSLLGFSFGAEGDILAYAAARYFAMDIYSTVLGLMTAGVGFAITLGAVLLSFILSRADSFAPFMMIAAVSVFLGAMNFLRLARQPPFVMAEQSAAA
jgi:MFS family permease